MLPGPVCESNSCYDSCEELGHMCDDTCEDGYPYGSMGCGADDGAHGAHCRACYTDAEDAMKADTHDHRAIM